MRRAILAAPLAMILLAAGCEPLSEQDQKDKAIATAALAEIGERLPLLKAKLEKLVERGKSIALEIAEIRAKVAAGSFPAADALELVAGLMSEKDTIAGEILATKDDISKLLELGKQADAKLDEIRKRNKWAWARTLGEGALSLVLAYFGIAWKRKAAALANVSSSLDARTASLVVAEKTRDALIATIDKHPEAKPTARAKAEEAGILPALAEAVRRIT